MFYSLLNLYKIVHRLKKIEMLAQSQCVPLVDIEQIYTQTSNAIKKLNKTENIR